MSGLLGKITDQLSGKNQPQASQQPPSSGVLHKVTDTLTGQKHPQDYQNQPAQMAGYGGNGSQQNAPFAGYPAASGGSPGYQQDAHPGEYSHVQFLDTRTVGIRTADKEVMVGMGEVVVVTKVDRETEEAMVAMKEATVATEEATVSMKEAMVATEEKQTEKASVDTKVAIVAMKGHRHTEEVMVGTKADMETTGKAMVDITQATVETRVDISS
ncbi:hypothetical protein LTR28_005202 [Elasticomyces elasticus]|nr:hypothetical protein LTR28_005202 [Elasticomyces elasticus]